MWRLFHSRKLPAMSIFDDNSGAQRLPVASRVWNEWLCQIQVTRVCVGAAGRNRPLAAQGRRIQSEKRSGCTGSTRASRVPDRAHAVGTDARHRARRPCIRCATLRVGATLRWTRRPPPAREARALPVSSHAVQHSRPVDASARVSTHVSTHSCLQRQCCAC